MITCTSPVVADVVHAINVVQVHFHDDVFMLLLSRIVTFFVFALDARVAAVEFAACDHSDSRVAVRMLVAALGVPRGLLCSWWWLSLVFPCMLLVVVVPLLFTTLPFAIVLGGSCACRLMVGVSVFSCDFLSS